MLDFHTLAELSRNHCIGICAFLVPANLLGTILTMILVIIGRPTLQIKQAASFAIIFALVMVLHVYSWFIVGVVMPPTYILLALAIACLVINSTASVLQQHQVNTLRSYANRLFVVRGVGG